RRAGLRDVAHEVALALALPDADRARVAERVRPGLEVFVDLPVAVVVDVVALLRRCRAGGRGARRAVLRGVALEHAVAQARADAGAARRAEVERRTREVFVDLSVAV